MADRSPEDRRDDHDAVDRAFADLVAGYHLTADRPDPLPPRPSAASSTGSLPDGEPAPAVPVPALDPGPAPSFPPPEPEAEDLLAEERFVPPPPAPLPKPAWPTLVGWLGMGYAVLAMLAVVIGVPLPGWVGWAAVAGFVGGFALLIARLPRDRPEGSDDGAVV